MNNTLASVHTLNSGWRLVRTDAAIHETPEQVDWSTALPDAKVPGTVAAALSTGAAAAANPPLDFDDYDWWFQCEFENGVAAAHSELLFDGLATIAEVWLNGERILESRNMFRAWRVDVAGILAKKNTLSIVFRAVNRDLSQKRPRPGWKTRLVSNQQLRWVRTTLLGRIPGWTPPVAPVGPWRPVRLAHYSAIRPGRIDVRATCDAATPSITVQADLHVLGGNGELADATLEFAGTSYPLALETHGAGVRLRATIDVGEVSQWSPAHPHLHRYALSLRVGDERVPLQSGELGFRRLEIDRSDDQLAFRLNGSALFCRGACWTVNDIVSLDGEPEALRSCLTLFRAAGGNMIRVGGTMLYESDQFYRLCDELGILVWQDFMFANMDYPSSDAEFMADVREEIDQQTRRLRVHPSVVAFCGNSEVEQQAAMLGLPAESWRNELFYTLIPDILEENCPDVPYFPSSPTEGALPFHNRSGPSHYFGVGAYQQPVDSVATAGVKFTSECLAFSNMPSDRSLIEHFHTAQPAVHHPDWKAGVPRDSAAGWDFEDVRDHYIKQLYRLDPVALRYADKDRYVAISQVVTGEVMQAVFNTWRHRDNDCSGALIWQLKDIVPGAGWGIIDVDGRPKPVWYFLKRCWGDVHCALLDRGLDGLEFRLDNDGETARKLPVNIKLLQHSNAVIVDESFVLEAAPGSASAACLDEIIGRFYDLTYRYRFGPAKHDVVVVTVLGDSDQQLETHCFFPNGHDIRVLDSAAVEIRCEEADGTIQLSIRAASFLQHVKLVSRTHRFDDNYFHLSPGFEKRVVATPLVPGGRKFRGVLSALNLATPVSFSLDA